MITPQTSKFPNSSSLKMWADRPVADDCYLFTSAVHYLLRVLLITVTEFKNCNLSLRSSALTYTILLSLVPMLAMSTAVVKELGGGNELRKTAYSYIESLEESRSEIVVPIEGLSPSATQLPQNAPNLTAHLRSAVDKLFNYVDRTNFATLGTIGVMGILLSVLLMLNHIESAMNAIWKVSAARPILRKIADYLTLMVLLPISINVAFAASAFLTSPMLALKLDQLIPFDWLQSLLLKPMPVFLIALTFYVMYIFFPNTRVKYFPAAIAATLAALLWFIVQNVYISLQLGVSNYNAIYGSFATLPLFLVWMYLGWIFILTGAQLAFAFQNEKTYRLVPFSGTPSLKLGAAFDIMDHIYSVFAAGEPVTSKTLAGNLPQYPPLVIEDTASELIKAGIIHISGKDGRLLPMSPSEQCDRQKIVSIILGTNTLDTTGGILSRKAVEAAGMKSNQPN